MVLHRRAQTARSANDPQALEDSSMLTMERGIDSGQEATRDARIEELVEEAKAFLESGNESLAAERLASHRVSYVELRKLRGLLEDEKLLPLGERDRLNPTRWDCLDTAFDDVPSCEDLTTTLGREKTLDEKHRVSLAILEKANIMTASALASKEFPAIRWAVPGLIPEGLTLLSAPPKAGKSWLALGLLLAVATGRRALGRVDVERGPCLYLSLEDSQRRLKDRLVRMGGNFPDALDLETSLPRSFGLLKFLDAYLWLHDVTRLIVVDTMGRALAGGDLNDYSDMTSILDPIQRLALEYHTGIVLIHHVRKGGDRGEGDPFSASLGSQGILGTIDTALILDRKRNETDALLYVIGRDVAEASYSLALDTSTMAWRMTNDPPEAMRLSRERRDIIEMLKKEGRPLRTGEIAASIGRSGSTVSEHCKALEEMGILYRPSYGCWACRVVTESAESAESESLFGIG
jgi:DNA-binding transcriptional ArsR family regulator